MITYVFMCDDCTIPEGSKVNSHGEKFSKTKIRDRDSEKAGWHPKSHEFIFYVDSTMKDKPSSPKCPKCGGVHTHSTLVDNNNHTYIRGNCYLDTAGAKRDMHVHKLQHEDPYSTMRVSGETDHLIDKFKNAGRDMAKIRRAGLKRNNALAIETSEKSKLEIASINKIEREIIKFIDANESSLRAGVEFAKLPPIHDPNKIISVLIKNGYVSVRKDGKICLTAEGRWASDNI